MASSHVASSSRRRRSHAHRAHVIVLRHERHDQSAWRVKESRGRTRQARASDCGKPLADRPIRLRGSGCARHVVDHRLTDEPQPVGGENDLVTAEQHHLRTVAVEAGELVLLATP
jgi:hypothetical protein